jgi:hypothetical protein
MELLLDGSELLKIVSNALASTEYTYLGVVVHLHAGGVLEGRKM